MKSLFTKCVEWHQWICNLLFLFVICLSSSLRYSVLLHIFIVGIAYVRIIVVVVVDVHYIHLLLILLLIIFFTCTIICITLIGTIIKRNENMRQLHIFIFNVNWWWQSIALLFSALFVIIVRIVRILCNGCYCFWWW